MFYISHVLMQKVLDFKTAATYFKHFMPPLKSQALKMGVYAFKPSRYLN